MNLLNTYETNVCRDALEHWYTKDAVREFVQNCICDGIAPYWDFDTDEGTIILGNQNTKLPPNILMMGKSSKRGDKSKVGQYGTGSVFAMSVLLDNNIDITIYNGDVIWKPCFKLCNSFGEEVMVIEEYSNPEPTTSYEVVIRGLSEEDCHNVIESTLVFQDREVLAETKYGKVISNPKDNNGGEIFVRGLFVTQNTRFKYSYDFEPEYLPLNQDRNLADTWELQKLCAKLWSCVEDVELVKEVIKSESYDCELVGDKWYTDNKVHVAVDSLAEDFFEEHGDCFVTNNHDTYEEMKKAGNTVKYVSSKPLYDSIVKSEKYQEIRDNTVMIKRLPLKDLIEQYVQESFDLLYENGLVSTEQMGTDEEREGNNHLADLQEQILERLGEL